VLHGTAWNYLNIPEGSEKTCAEDDLELNVLIEFPFICKQHRRSREMNISKAQAKYNNKVQLTSLSNATYCENYKTNQNSKE